MKQILLSLIFGLIAYFSNAQQPFITTWKTDNPGTSEDNQITIPTYPGETYNYTVNWGDGNSDTAVTGNITHTYASPGTYSVQISGAFPHIYFANEGDKEKFLSVDQWGGIQWGSMRDAFSGCIYMEMNAIDIPDLALVESTQSMFQSCNNMQGNPSMGAWDLSQVIVMDFMFWEAHRFNQDLSAWDVSMVNSMRAMFDAAHEFNSPLGTWNVGKVTNMERMFTNAWAFNQPLGSWDLSSVTNLALMFLGAESFNQDIGNWDVRNVQNMALTFSSARAFNQDLSAWNMGSVTNIYGMFVNANSFNGNISGWNTSSIEYMGSAFYGATAFNQNLGSWDISAVKSMQDMFNRSGMSQENYDAILINWAQLSSLQSSVILGAENITYCTGAAARQQLIETNKWNIIDGGAVCPAVVPFITTWKTDNPGTSEGNQITIPTYPEESYDYTVDWGDGSTDTGVTGNITHTYAAPGEYSIAITGIFPRIYFNNNNYTQNTGDKDKILSIDQWGDNTWRSFENAFSGCSNVDVLATDLPILNSVTDISSMFYGCHSLIGNAAIGQWEVSSIQDFYGTFREASLFNQDISAWDVSGANNFIAMFQNAQGFDQSLNSWDVSGVLYFGSMFYGASSFNQPLGNWDLSHALSLDYMFHEAIAFNQDIGNWDVSSVNQMFGMFSRAMAFDQNLGAWDVSDVTDMTAMFEGAGLSVQNYDALLQGWSTLTGLRSGLVFDAGSSQFCEAGAARLKLLEEYGWNIKDGDSNCPGISPFITTWKTDNPGDSGDNQITIPTFSTETYNYSVAWGDGTSDSGVTGNITHTYSTPGVYEIEITGEFPRLFFDFAGEKEKILTVEQWGDITWSSMELAFAGCINLNLNAVDAPDLSNTDNLQSTFAGCTTMVGNASMNTWDVSPIQNMNAMFEMASQFNQPLGNWYVSNVSDMMNMFRGASYFNRDISGWDVSNVTTMKAMFHGATAFDNDLGTWNVTNVLDMSEMFIDVTLSQEHYDGLLEGWNALPDLQHGVSFNAGNSQYCEAGDARQNVIDTYGWSVTDAGEYCPPFIPFITTWKTDNYGATGPNQISIPTFPGETYDYAVDWGDGTNDSGVSGGITHTYATPGIYKVSITGLFPRLYFNNPYDNFVGDNDKILEVNQWGSIAWSSMEFAFAGCSNLDVTAMDTPDLSGVTKMNHMFDNCTSLVGNTQFELWETGNIQNMQGVFVKTSLFNQPIGSWDTSNVTNMNAMFLGAEIFNQPIGNWDTSGVTIMAVIFWGATAFNQDLNQWDVSNVKSFNGAFSNAYSFNKPIGNWNVGKATEMSNMFVAARSFNQPLNKWDVSNVQNFGGMFGRATSFNQDLSSWDVSSATNLGGMFGSAESFNQDISQWEVQNVTAMDGMFSNAFSFDQDLGDWDVSGVRSMSGMFANLQLSTENYDGILKGWSSLPSLQNGVSFGVGESQYCDGASAHQYLIDTYGWVITDAGEDCAPSLPFITTWKTDNPGSSDDNQIMIPTFPGETYNYTVDWGDGTSDTGVTGNITHTYDSAGIYSISITDDFPQIYFNDEGEDRDKLLAITQWGSIQWKSMSGAFNHCTNLDVTAPDTPDLSQVLNLDYMFGSCTSLKGTDAFNDWDVSNIIDLYAMFVDASSFNANIGNWNVSKVNNMSFLFAGATSFNQDIGTWDVSQVTNMNAMFSAAASFNQPIGYWNVQQVTDMGGMFLNASVFNKDIGSWNVGNVTNMGAMFFGAAAFNQDISNWDTKNVNSFGSMFTNAVSFNQDIGNWVVSSATNMYSMFAYALSFNQDISNWEVDNVSNMDRLFANATSFDQHLGSWNVGKVTTMTNMFLGVTLSRSNYDGLLQGWNSLPSVQQGVMFNGGNSFYCEGTNSRQNLIDSYGWIITDGGAYCPGNIPFVTTWKTDNPGVSEDNQITIPTYPGGDYDYTVDWGDGTSDAEVTGGITHTYNSPGTYTVSITGYFPRIYFNNLFNQNPGDNNKIIAVNQWGSYAWTSMEYAFAGCSNLQVEAADSPDLSRVTEMGYMFADCRSLLGSATFNNWDVSSVVQINHIFFFASAFNANIGNWDVSNVQGMGFAFSATDAFNQDIGNWNVGNVRSMQGTFSYATAFNQEIGAWDVSNVVSMDDLFNGAEIFNQNVGNWNVGNVIRMSGMFFKAAAFNQEIGGWDVSKVTHMNGMFKEATAFNQDISGWDISNVVDMNSMFQQASSFNQDIGAWNVANVVQMGPMFAEATSFNQDISGWDVGNVIWMYEMFRGATSFDQDLGNWDVTMVNRMEDMFLDAGLSVENYDKLLKGWNSLTSLQNGVSFHAGNSKYCESSAERQLLIETFGWTITDGGENPGCNEDKDNDGVADHLDACPDTPAGATVTSDGCLLLAADIFCVETIGESCPDANNAQILITSAVPCDFTATINGTGYDFSNSLNVEDLSPGTYTLCITVAGQAFEQCYTLELAGAASISGKALAGNGKLDIRIEQGTAPYKVVVNGRPVFQTFSRAFAVDAQAGDYVEVNSGKACEGTFSKVIEGLLANAAFPNPTTGIFELALPGPYTEIGIDVFSMHSQLMSTATYPVSGGKVQLDISTLPEGVYLIKPHLQNPATFKIVKQ